MVYPALLPLMRTPRLPVVDWTDAPRRFKWTRPFRRKTEIWFLCVCHHVPTGLYYCTTAALMRSDLTWRSFSKAKLVEVAWLSSLGCMGKLWNTNEVYRSVSCTVKGCIETAMYDMIQHTLVRILGTLALDWYTTSSVTGLRNCILRWWWFKVLNDRPLLLFGRILSKRPHCIVSRVPVCCN